MPLLGRWVEDRSAIPRRGAATQPSVGLSSTGRREQIESGAVEGSGPGEIAGAHAGRRVAHPVELAVVERESALLKSVSMVHSESRNLSSGKETDQSKSSLQAHWPWLSRIPSVTAVSALKHAKYSAAAMKSVIVVKVDRALGFFASDSRDQKDIQYACAWPGDAVLDLPLRRG